MPAGPTDDPLEVTTQIRSAAMILGDSRAGFVDPGGPLRAAHVRAARAELEQRGRATFFAERWATQPDNNASRVIWRGWAQSFTTSLSWEQRADGDVIPRARERLDELTSLLSGPATRGELRVLGAYEAYFQTLFTLGWALVVRADPGGDARRLAAPGGSAVVDVQNGFPIAVVRTGDATAVALSATCTHAGCIVDASAGGLHCPCHDADFDLTGAVLRGPTTIPLPVYAATPGSNGIVVDLS